MPNTLRISLDCDRELFDHLIDQLLEEGLEDKIRACGVDYFERYGTSDGHIRSRHVAKTVTDLAHPADDPSPPAT